MTGPRSPFVLALLLAAGIASTRAAGAQCILANPSFEMGGSGTTFGGWSQFGSCGSSTRAVHGAKAARVSSPGTAWGVSGFWQPLDTEPGEAWSASVCVLNPSSRPLTGPSAAIVNVEWRDSGGNLISYESHPVATASTPADQVQVVSFQTQPAPAGAASARLLLGALQGPNEPVADVIYDQVTFNSLSSPTLEQTQWLDFPGGRTLTFSGRSWRVKGPGYYGPGPSMFSDGASHVWVDGDGRLHLTIKQVSGTWYSTEVALVEALGYGDYVFTTRGRLDTLDPRAVLGLYIWEYGPCYEVENAWWGPYNEVDIEYGRWGSAGNAIGQYVAQPYDYPGNLVRFDATFAVGEVTSHAFRWLPDRCEFRAWRGGPTDEATSVPIHSWTYAGPHLPRPESPRVHLNLWRFNGAPAANQEVVLDAFTFVPACPSGPCGALAVAPPIADGTLELAARPNPFRSSAAIRFATARGGHAEIAVYDLQGRRVRTLHDGPLSPGGHEATWDGRDDAGAGLPAGVYLCRLRTEDGVGTRRMVLVR